MDPHRTIRRLALAASLLVAAPAAALNMTFGDVVVQNLSTDGFTANNSFLSFDGGTTDQLYQMYGYLGTSSGVVAVTTANFTTRQAITQVAPDAATSQLRIRNSAASTLGLANGAVDVSYRFTLVNDTSAADFDRLDWDITLTNRTTGTLNLVFYSYLDLDLYGTFGDDIATADATKMTVTDAANPTAPPYVWRASGGTASHWQVGPYASVQTQLNNMTSAQNLADTTGTFGPADFTGAFQYNITLAAGASVVLGSTVPEPAANALLVLGGAAFAVQLRRRRRHARALEMALRTSREPR